MAVLTVQEIDRSGLQPSFVAAAGGGDSFPNDGRTYLETINGSGGAVTVTAAIQKQTDAVTPAGKATSVAAGQREKFGPFPPEVYNDANGRVQITYSGVTSVTVGVFRLP